MDETLARELAAFSLSPNALEEVRRTLFARITEGLSRDGAELRALPAYLPPPDRDRHGTALVIDIGGTNARAAVVELAGGRRARVVSGPIKERLPTEHGHVKMERAQLFAFQAALAKRLDPPRGLPIGYCFSYPSELQPDRDGKLIAWTKGIEIPGVEGTLVGRALFDAIAREGLQPSSVTVLNDTVASMFGGAFAYGGAIIGLIVGTGTNMSAFFDAAAVPKLAREKLPAQLAVNLESGNFHPPHLTRFDDALDGLTDNPGRQRFEKAVSGHYLPYLFQRVLPGHPGFSPEQGSGALVDFRDKSLEEEPLAVAEALLARSADLVAAALAGLIDHHAPGAQIGILAEGSLFWNDPKYAPRVAATLATLLGSTERAKILSLDDANLIGSACAALAR